MRPCKKILINTHYKISFLLGRFSYSNPGLQEIAFYKDGVPFNQNSRTKNISIERNSPDLIYFYENFLQCFGEKAYDISLERYGNM